MNLRSLKSTLHLSVSTLRLSAARGSAVRLATATPAGLSLTPAAAAACPRCYCSHVKVRSFFSYMKRKVIAPPTPPYSHVCHVGNPVLRSCAAAVDPAEVTGPEVQAVISTMVKVMRKLECVGLSAPQVGVPLRIIMLEYSYSMMEESSVASIKARGLSVQPLRIFINPELRVLDARTASFQEGCESIVGFSAVVPRFLSVEVSGTTFILVQSFVFKVWL